MKFKSVSIKNLEDWHNLKLQEAGKYWKGKYLIYKKGHFYLTEEFIEKFPWFFKIKSSMKQKNKNKKNNGIIN